MNTLTELTQQLHRLRAEAGNPSLRALAEWTGVSHSNVGDAFRGQRLVGWTTIKRLVAELGGDVTEFGEAYAEIIGEQKVLSFRPTLNEQILTELIEIRTLLEKLNEPTQADE